jgi:hypothetical protein
MRKAFGLVLLLALVAAGCGGGQGEESTTGTPQGAAKLWLNAAMASDDARLRELSLDAFQDQAAGMAAQIREKIDPGAQWLWGGSGQEGADYNWTATAPGGVVFLKVRAVGADEYRVAEVSTSW